ncbi:hypothetical protein GCM10022200_15860 [Microbacterium awajiense]|uniref:ABC transporter n=1 Tax=Microbacterium awajiense TaxID=415214 RepID=A0ABP7AJF5_9MICO
MSDPKATYGEPVDEPGGDEDVVGSAHEGLADAEAAGRDAVDEPVVEETVVEETVVDDAPVASPSTEPVVEETVVEETVVAEPVADVPAEPDAETKVWTEPAADATATTAYDTPAVTSSEPAAGAAVAAPQPIFVQAPEAPRPRGNRAAAGAIGLLAALTFAALYLATGLIVGAVSGEVTADNVGSTALAALGTWSLWVPTVVFFIAFWLLGAIVNRGRWGIWVHLGLLVGVAAYGGHLLGQLFQAPFWMLTASEGAALVESQLLVPLSVAAFVFARELTIWYGAWVAARGKRVTELNREAQREYERTLEAGPQLVRQ